MGSLRTSGGSVSVTVLACGVRGRAPEDVEPRAPRGELVLGPRSAEEVELGVVQAAMCDGSELADVYVCAERCADGPDDAADAELLHPAHVGLDIAPHAASALDGPVEAHWSVSAIDRA